MINKKGRCIKMFFKFEDLSNKEEAFLSTLRNGLHRGKDEICMCSTLNGIQVDIRSEFDDLANKLMKEKFIKSNIVHNMKLFKLTGKGFKYLDKKYPIRNVY